MSEHPKEAYSVLEFLEAHQGKRLLSQTDIPDPLRPWLDYCEAEGLIAHVPYVVRTAKGRSAQFMRDWEPAEGGDSPPEGDGFISFKELPKDLFGSDRKARSFLDKHPEIRQRKPSSQRLEVHAADWIHAVTEHFPEPTDAQIDAYVEGIEKRKSETDKKRKAKINKKCK